MSNGPPDQSRATLRLGASPLRRSHFLALMAVLVGLPLLVLAAIALVAAVCAGPERLGALMAEGLRQALEKDPSIRYALWALAALTPLLAVFALGQRQARLGLGPAGLQAHIPRWLGVGLTRQTAGDWRIGWESIRQARLVLPAAGRNAAQVVARARLAISTERGETWLAPFIWTRAGGPDHRLGLGELLHPRRLDPLDLLARAPLVQVLRERGFPVQPDRTSGLGGPGFDLARHGGMVTQLAVAAIAGVYTLADGFLLGPYQPLEPLPPAPFAVAATGAALAAVVLGRGAPRLERWAVGLLAVAAVGAAVYPATLRLNALTAEPEQVTYRAVAAGRFTAPGNLHPPVDLSGYDLDAYWAQYPPGAQHLFTVLSGVAGFRQLDLAPFYRRTRAFYSAVAGANAAPAAGQ